MSLSLNHVSIRTLDLEATRRFYVEALGLTAGPRPEFPFPGLWLYLGPLEAYQHAAVHVIGIDAANPTGLDQYLGERVASTLRGSGAVDHVAFSATDLSGTLARLARCGVPHRERTVPDVGLHQVFVDDPNGILVELNFSYVERQAWERLQRQDIPVPASGSQARSTAEPRQDRLPPLDPLTWSAEQRACAEEIIQGPRGALIAPFVPLLRSPELCTHAQRMGEYLRYRSAIGLRLSELAILVTARHWDQQVEWAIHAPIAEHAGIAPEVVQAIALKQAPAFGQADERVVHELSCQLLQDKGVRHDTWATAISLLGEPGVVDLTGIVGYYTLLSMVMNGAQTPVPPALPRRLPLVASD